MRRWTWLVSLGLWAGSVSVGCGEPESRCTTDDECPRTSVCVSNRCRPGDAGTLVDASGLVDAGAVGGDAGSTVGETLTLATLTARSDAQCVARPTGTTILDSGADGVAWVYDGTRFSTLAPGGAITTSAVRPSAAPLAFEARSADEAIWVAGSFVEYASGGEESRVALPAMAGEPRAVCGRPGERELVVATDRGLVRHASTSFELFPFASGEELRSGLSTSTGACIGESAALWFSTSASVYELSLASTPSMLAIPTVPAGARVMRDGASAVAVANGVLYVVERRELAIYRAVEGSADAAGMGHGVVWASFGGAIVSRSTDGTWTRWPLDGEAVALVADDAGGAWATTTTSFCRLSPTPYIGLRGIGGEDHVANIGTTRALDVAVDGATAIRLSIDGTNVGQASAATLSVAAAPLGAAGWHELEVRATTATGELRRSLRYGVGDSAPISFATAVDPLLDANCVGCHGPAGPQREFVHQYDVFRDVAMSAVARLDGSDPRRMPPSGDADPTLVGVIESWIAGGMQP